MTTSPLFTGRQSEMLFADEVTYGVAPGGNWTRSYFYANEIAPSQPFEEDALLGVSGLTARDPLDPAPGLYSLGGSVRVPFDLNHLGHWLRLAFGAPVTTGAADFQHVFRSGAAALPTRSIETKKAAAGRFSLDTGLAARSIAFGASKEGGFRSVTLDLVGKKQTILSASGGGNPVDALPLMQMPAMNGIVRWNDVAAGKALAADMTYSTGMDGERFLDGAGDGETISEIVPASAPSATGSLRLRGASPALDADARSKTPRELEIEYQISATRSLILTLPRVFLDLSGEPINGPAGTEQSFGFRAAQSTTAAMLIVTLKNQIASY